MRSGVSFNRKHTSSGFTIVELIVVIAVIAILVTISIVSYGSWQRSVVSNQVKNELVAVSQAMESARNFLKEYPDSLPDSYTPSGDVQLTPQLLTTTEYCIDGTSTQDTSVEFYIYSKTLDQGAIEGTCLERPDLTPPDAPTGVAVAGSTTTSLDVEWNDVAGAASYVVQCASDQAFIQDLKQVSVNHPTVSTTMSGYVSNLMLYCRVKAVNTKGSSAWSTMANGRTIAPPSAPSIASTINAQGAAVFSWPAVSGAVSYTLQYRINGGSWISGFSQQNLLSYTVSGYHDKTIGARVVSVGPTGAVSTYATSSIDTPLWVTLGYQNNWSDYGSPYATGAFTKTSAGVVVLKGLLKRSGTIVNGETIATLPVGYRPQYTITFMTGITGWASASIMINADGNIVAWTDASETATALDRIAFMPAGTTFTPFSPLLNGWANGISPAAPMSYTVDSIGRVFLQGRVEPGTTSADTEIVSLESAPSDMTVSPKLIVGVRSGSGGHNVINIGSSVTLRGVGVGSALFPQTMYYPDAAGATWSTISLQNGWVPHGTNNASPEYTKAPDGIVTLKGLIKSGTTSTQVLLFTLPVGYRPSKTLVFASVCNDAPCRIDVQSDGEVRGSGTSSSWTSLSGLNFVAEQ